MGEKLNENIFEFIASECLLKLSGNCILEKKPFMICGMTLGWVGEVLREIQQIVCFVNINVSELALPLPFFSCSLEPSLNCHTHMHSSVLCSETSLDRVIDRTQILDTSVCDPPRPQFYPFIPPTKMGRT